MTDIVDIVEQEIVNKMDNILSVVTSSTNTVTVCSAKWVRIGKVLTDSDSNEYTITDVNYSTNTITLNTNFIGENDFVTIERPYYFHGTPLVTSEEWGAFTNNEENKTPFVWLIEPVVERLEGRESSRLGEFELVCYFVDGRDHVNWTNDNIHEKRSNILYAMANEFVDTIERNPIFPRLANRGQLRNLAKFGRETQQGFVENILDAQLTALELRLTLPIYKTSNLCIC